MLMALLQPPPEVYELFDDIMLLSEGMHGARLVFVLAHQVSYAVPEGSGFMCSAFCSAEAGKPAQVVWHGVRWSVLCCTHRFC